MAAGVLKVRAAAFFRWPASRETKACAAKAAWAPMTTGADHSIKPTRRHASLTVFSVSRRCSRDPGSRVSRLPCRIATSGGLQRRDHLVTNQRRRCSIDRCLDGLRLLAVEILARQLSSRAPAGSAAIIGVGWCLPVCCEAAVQCHEKHRLNGFRQPEDQIKAAQLAADFVNA